MEKTEVTIHIVVSQVLAVLCVLLVDWLVGSSVTGLLIILPGLADLTFNQAFWGPFMWQYMYIHHRLSLMVFYWLLFTLGGATVWYPEFKALED